MIHPCPGSRVDPVAMALPEQMPCVGTVGDLAFCLVTKYTLRGLSVVGSRVSNSHPGDSYISLSSPRLHQTVISGDVVTSACSVLGHP